MEEKLVNEAIKTDEHVDDLTVGVAPDNEDLDVLSIQKEMDAIIAREHAMGNLTDEERDFLSKLDLTISNKYPEDMMGYAELKEENEGFENSQASSTNMKALNYIFEQYFANNKGVDNVNDIIFKSSRETFALSEYKHDAPVVQDSQSLGLYDEHTNPIFNLPQPEINQQADDHNQQAASPQQQFGGSGGGSGGGGGTLSGAGIGLAKFLAILPKALAKTAIAPVMLASAGVGAGMKSLSYWKEHRVENLRIGIAEQIAEIDRDMKAMNTDFKNYTDTDVVNENHRWERFKQSNASIQNKVMKITKIGKPEEVTAMNEYLSPHLDKIKANIPAYANNPKLNIKEDAEKIKAQIEALTNFIANLVEKILRKLGLGHANKLAP